LYVKVYSIVYSEFQVLVRANLYSTIILDAFEQS
jgi:hypothetical protein